MLFGEYVKFPPGATWTLVFRNPPTGSPSGGDVLVVAVEAAALKASIVLPVVGLKVQSVRTVDLGLAIDARINGVDHSRLAMVPSCLPTIHPDWFRVINCDRPCSWRCGSEICRRHKPGEEAAREGVAWILE